jgi:hypothetical protein
MYSCNLNNIYNVKKNLIAFLEHNRQVVKQYHILLIIELER